MTEFDKEAQKRITRAVRVGKDCFDHTKAGLSSINLKRFDRAVKDLQTKWEWNEVERLLLQDKHYLIVAFTSKSVQERTGIESIMEMPFSEQREKLTEYASRLGTSIGYLLDNGMVDEAAQIEEIQIYTLAAITYLEEQLYRPTGSYAESGI